MKITNFRDIGGYKTEDGKYVKKGCFYRSSVINFKDEEDKAEFIGLGIKTILDLRSTKEAREMPDDEVDGVNYIFCSAIKEDNENEGNFDVVSLIKKGEFKEIVDYFDSTYDELPFDNDAYKKLFSLMLHDETPVAFHCSAGKDRTGVAAYLILKTLGVDDETIMKDYLLSNEYRKAENEYIIAKYPVLLKFKGLLYVREENLKRTIKAIENKYKTFEDYLLSEYNITNDEITFLRNKYLED